MGLFNEIRLVSTWACRGTLLAGLVIILSCSSSAHAQPSPVDRQALIDLYNSTGGPNWVNNTNWLSPAPIGQWFGVKQSPNPDGEFVQSLDLLNNNLIGDLPPQWADLISQGAFRDMTDLILSGNNVGGQLPPEIGQISGLVSLVLGSNQFSGTIPPSYGGLSSLFLLDLSFNQLSGSIPPEIFDLINIELIFFTNNNLSGPIPTGIGNMSDLTKLHLSENQLSGPIPTDIASLPLTELLLSNNQMTGPIPASLATNTDLRFLFLDGNNLSGSIPQELATLPLVQNLRLSFNQLSGVIPSSLGDITSLEHLELTGNLFVGSIPPSLGNLSNLTHLDLGFNSLNGLIPPELGNLSALTMLSLSSNQLTGAVPSEFNQLSNLDNLYLSANAITTLPDLSGIELLQLWVDNNFLQFDSLEPNFGIPGFFYSPQRRVGSIQSYTIDEGDDLTLSFEVGGVNNIYEWLFNTLPIPDAASSNQFTITNATPGDAGFYSVSITNSQVPILSLLSETITVIVNAAPQGSLVVTNTNDSGDGSLRAAIQTANDTPNVPFEPVDEITFAIPGPGPHVIRPNSPLPPITEYVIIDAISQPGASCGTSIATHTLRIILDGSNAGSVDGGLSFVSGGTVSTISGFAINNFDGAGIYLSAADFVTITCNYIGTDVSGLISQPNMDGIHISTASGTLIGSDTRESGNLISGNSGSGIRIDGSGLSTSNVVYNNFIGTNRNGTAALGNSVGISVTDATSTILGLAENVTQELGNLISGNTVRAVDISGTGSTGTFIQGNLIGTDLNGIAPIPNGQGIRIRDGATQSLIGGFLNGVDSEFGNIIAYNNGPGVIVSGITSTGNRISSNGIFDNNGLGIDLGADGPTPNDPGDADEGPNRLLNTPVIESAVIDGAGDLVISYRVDSGGIALRIEFFISDIDDEEGAVFIGEDTYFLNEAGQTVQANLGNAVSLGVIDPDGIVATSLDNFFNTSEFSGVPEGGSGTLVVTEPESLAPSAGAPVQLSATLPDNFNPSGREICYKRTGEAVFACSEMQANGALNSASIPSGFVTERGLQYYYRFVDGGTVTTVPEFDPEDFPFNVAVPFTSLRAPGPFPRNEYRMISVPLNLIDRRAESVLDELGPYDPLRWRLLQWDNNTNTYREYPNLSDDLQPCEAFWLITFDGRGFDVDEGTSVDPFEPCSVTARPGWTQFGIPYAFPILWDDVFTAGFLNAPVHFDASQGTADPYTYDVEVLQPWDGYWVFNPGTQAVQFFFSPIEALGKSAKYNAPRRYLSESDYELNITATIPLRGFTDSQNRIGFSPLAAVGLDELDFAEAPGIGDFVRLSIVEGDVRWAGSFKPASLDGQAWNIEVAAALEGGISNKGETVRISLDEFGQRPNAFDVRVLDLDLGRSIRVDSDGFEVRLTESLPVRHLRILVGTETFANEMSDDISLLPEQIALEQNYPNPFNPTTQIRYQIQQAGAVELFIYDPLGRKIRTLVQSVLQAGWYDTTWDGRDEIGQEAASGVYFYKLVTETESRTRSMVLLR